MDKTEAKLASSWTYIKEGNASFVIGHKTEHVIYRMRKCDPKEINTGDSREAECRVKNEYIKNVLLPLFGKFITTPKCVAVTAAFVESVATSFEGERPQKRRSKVVDPSQRFVLSQPNLCFLGGRDRGSTLTIELKPKLGYILTTRHVASRNNSLSQVCNFCTQQHFKKKEGAWNYFSKYCPVNLFSGDPARMRLAIEGLFSTPQNNLCVFKDGERIYPEEGKRLPSEEEQEVVTMAIHSWLASDAEKTEESTGNGLNFTKRPCIQDVISLVLQALCKSADTGETDTLLPWQHCSVGSSHASITGSDATPSQCLLPEGSILQRILVAQQLDTHGIDFIHPLYQRYREYITEHPEESDRLPLKGLYTASFLHPCPASNKRYSLADIGSLPIEECVRLLRGHSVSRTARDCSIMVTLQPAGPTQDSLADENLVSISGRRFHFACHLIDLDPKTPAKIPQYYHLEQEILAAYMDR